MFGLRKVFKLCKSSHGFPVIVALVIVGLILILELDTALPWHKKHTSSPLGGFFSGKQAQLIYRKETSQVREVEDFIIQRPPSRGERHVAGDEDLDLSAVNTEIQQNESKSKTKDTKDEIEYEYDDGNGDEDEDDLIDGGGKSSFPDNISEMSKGVLVLRDDDDKNVTKTSPTGAEVDKIGHLNDINGNNKNRAEAQVEQISQTGNKSNSVTSTVDTRNDNTKAQSKDATTGNSSNKTKSEIIAEKSQSKQTNKTASKENETKKKNGHDVGKKSPKGHLGDDTSYWLSSGKQRSLLHNRIVKKFTLTKEEARDSFINLHRYKYVLDSAACDKGNPKFIILVHSKFNNFVKRSKIRNTYAKNKIVNGVEFAVTFILGKPNLNEIETEKFTAKKVNGWVKKKTTLKDKQRKLNETIQDLETESKVFQDIVMGNFTDSYRNLTIKHILAYDWVLKRCLQDLAFIVKVDDDILVNTYRIARLLQGSTRAERKGLLICDVPQGQRVMRGAHNKWFVSKEEYPFRFYPPWCKGYGVFMTKDVVRKLYDASADMRYFWIDDVYVTGMLAWRAGIHVRNFRQRQMTITHNQFKPGDVRAMFVWAPFDKKHTHREYWKHMVKAQDKSDAK